MKKKMGFDYKRVYWMNIGPDDDDDVVTLDDLLTCGTSQLVSLFATSFCVEWDWLLSRVPRETQITIAINWSSRTNNSELPLEEVWGVGEKIVDFNGGARQVRVIHPKIPHGGIMHAKLWILTFSCGTVRLVVSSANLTSEDCMSLTQQVWVSDLPQHHSSLVDSCCQVCPFRESLLFFIGSLCEDCECLPLILEPLASHCTHHISSSSIHLIPSLPGQWPSSQDDDDHVRVALPLLQKIISSTSHSLHPPLFQQSAVGGITSDWIIQMCNAVKCQHLQLRYPSRASATRCLTKSSGIICIKYLVQSNKMTFPNVIMLDQTDDKVYHCKCICTDQWVCISSQNLNPSAWGQLLKDGSCLVKNYDLAVFLPDPSVWHKLQRSTIEYGPDDTPWVLDVAQVKNAFESRQGEPGFRWHYHYDRLMEEQ